MPHSPGREEEVIGLNGTKARRPAIGSEGGMEEASSSASFESGIRVKSKRRTSIGSPEREGEGEKKLSPVRDFTRVWDLLLEAEALGSLVVHPSPHTVLVFNRFQGPWLREGIRGFAIHTEVFEQASLRAMQTPVVGREYDFEKFLITLYPRMLLFPGNWKTDVELLRYSVEIAKELILLFGVESRKVWRSLMNPLSSRSFGEWEVMHGGILLDLVLEMIRMGRGRKARENGAIRRMAPAFGGDLSSPGQNETNF